MKKLSTAALALLSLLAISGSEARAQNEQSVLGPGMYVFQTRTRSATCGDDDRTGYVSSFMAPIHGIPGSRTMRTHLANSEYFPNWRITVNAQNHVLGRSTLQGASGPNAPTNEFDVHLERGRFVGTGTRRYRANGRMCEVEYDALLRRIDV